MGSYAGGILQERHPEPRLVELEEASVALALFVGLTLTLGMWNLKMETSVVLTLLPSSLSLRSDPAPKPYLNPALRSVQAPPRPLILV